MEALPSPNELPEYESDIAHCVAEGLMTFDDYESLLHSFIHSRFSGLFAATYGQRYYDSIDQRRYEQFIDAMPIMRFWG